MSKKPADTVTVIYHKEGKTLHTAQDPAGLIDLVKEYTESPDDILELIITEDTIKDIRANDTALEVVYPEARPFTIRAKELTFDRILIPLEGEFTRDGHCVIFCGDTTYSYGPYVKFNALAKLKEYVGTMHWE